MKACYPESSPPPRVSGESRAGFSPRRPRCSWDALRSAVVKFFESLWKTELGDATNEAFIDGYLDAVPSAAESFLGQ